VSVRLAGRVLALPVILSWEKRITQLYLKTGARHDNLTQFYYAEGTSREPQRWETAGNYSQPTQTPSMHQARKAPGGR
jgi:hypothetical protein